MLFMGKRKQNYEMAIDNVYQRVWIDLETHPKIYPPVICYIAMEAMTHL